MDSTTGNHLSPPQSPPESCAQGHRSTLIISTSEGGAICLFCFSNLISNPKSPTIHISYALSQLSLALTQPHFLQTFLTYHSHFLISPLVNVLSTIDDDPIASQITDLILKIIDHADDDVYTEFVSRVSDKLSSGSLAWSRKQLYMLHCLGILLNFERSNPYGYIKDIYALVFNLVTGLQLSSEEIQGEIFFLLYKISILQGAYIDDDNADVLSANCPNLLHLSLEALMKCQGDDVRLNCVALLKALAQRGSFEYLVENDSFEVMQTTEQVIDRPPLKILFAEAIKGSLLSSETQVQIATLDLIFQFLAWECNTEKCQVLVEENIADYVFEILRLSGCKDSLVTSCIQVLDLLSNAEQYFRQRLAIGFTTLIPVLRYVIGIPFHPVQSQSLKLIFNCISNCPGVISTLHVEELALILTGLLKKHVEGETGMLPETFILACSILVALMKCSSSCGSASFSISIQDSLENAVSICLSDYGQHPGQLMHSLYLVKEAYAYSHDKIELRKCIVNICKEEILPWFLTTVNEIEDEDIALAVFETFHSILDQVSDEETKLFTSSLVSSSWFSFSFGCLGVFPSENMKLRVYSMLGSIIDVLLGNDLGQLIRDAASYIPSDPIDLLFLLGQKSSHDLELSSSQLAVLIVLYISSLHDDRIADDKMILASLEQYILLNGNELLNGPTEPVTVNQLVSLYGLCRSLAKMSYQMPYSPEAERILFQILSEKDWDLNNTKIHMSSLKWLFQQENICNSLSEQLLKFCNSNYYNGNQILDVNVIAELTASGDNFMPLILVCLVMEDEQEDDVILSVLSVITKVIEIIPGASDQLSVNGISGAIRKIYSSSQDVFMATSRLAFCFLQSVRSESISDDEDWIAIVMKLLDYLIPNVAAQGWTQECLLIIGILSLVLYHSTNHTLVNASKTILLNTPLISLINNTINEACSKGPALIDCDEGTKTGESLVYLLLLLFFSLRSMQAVLPGISDWRNLFNEASKTEPLSYISIHCHTICKLMHFGSPIIKLISSYCLVELFNKISDELKTRRGYISSVIAILEGLIFFSDIRVSINSANCLSMIIEWEEMNMEKNQWCRLIVEEMIFSFAIPALASKKFTIHHKPAVYIAVALLKMKKKPKWLDSVLDSECIASIIRNISSNHVTIELVIFFRELLNAGYLKTDQIASLNKIFQTCRKHVNYTEETQNLECSTGQVAESLISIMFYQSSLNMNFDNSESRLLHEIKLFSMTLMEEDEN